MVASVRTFTRAPKLLPRIWVEFFVSPTTGRPLLCAFNRRRTNAETPHSLIFGDVRRDHGPRRRFVHHLRCGAAELVGEHHPRWYVVLHSLSSPPLFANLAGYRSVS